MNGWRVTPIEDVEIIYEWDAWRIVCSWPVKSRRTEISTTMRITYEGERLVLGATRLNVLSASSKTAIARVMRNAVKGDDRVPVFFEHVCDDVARWYGTGGSTRRVEPAIRRRDRWLLYPLWPASGGTLVAAGTNSFKSLTALAVAVQVTVGHEVLRGNTRSPAPRPILYCDWEASADDFAERLYAILRGAGLPVEPCVAYRQLKVPFPDVVDRLADEVAREGYAGVVLDSLSAAAGGSLVDDDVANGFWDGVAALGVPTFIPAHKSADAIRRRSRRAFGSVMHENRSRLLWDAQRADDDTRVRWEVESDNNTGHKGFRLAWRIDIATEGEHEERYLDAVTFEGINPNDVRLAAAEGDTIADRAVYALMESGPMLVGELASAIGTTGGSLRQVLSRHKDLFHKLNDGRWSVTNAGDDTPTPL